MRTCASLSLMGPFHRSKPSENLSCVRVSALASNTAIRSTELSVTSAASLTFLWLWRLVPSYCFSNIFIGKSPIVVCVFEQGEYCATAAPMLCVCGDSWKPRNQYVCVAALHVLPENMTDQIKLLLVSTVYWHSPWGAVAELLTPPSFLLIKKL